MVILINFIELFFVLSAYNTFFGCNKFKDKVFSIAIAIIGANIHYLLSTVFKAHIIVSFFLVFILIAWIFSMKNKSDVVNTMIQILMGTMLLTILELICVPFIYMVFKGNDIDYGVYIICLVVIFSLGLIIIRKIDENFNLEFIKEISQRNGVNIIILNLIVLIVFIKVVGFYELYSIRNSIEMLILFIIVILLNLYHLRNTSRKKEIDKRGEINRNINPLIEDLLQDMKSKEHEYNNHLTVIYSMIQVCSPEELKDKAKIYLGDMREKNQYLAEVAYIKNTIVQAIVYNKLKEAEKCDITLNHNIKSDLENIKLDDSELTVILSNLINNAIEAAKKQLNKEVDVYIGELEGKYIIEVSNWIDDEKFIDLRKIFKAGFSTKGKGRGYGLHNIKNIVEKTKGKIDAKIERNRVVFTISI